MKRDSVKQQSPSRIVLQYNRIEMLSPAPNIYIKKDFMEVMKVNDSVKKCFLCNVQQYQSVRGFPQDDTDFFGKHMAQFYSAVLDLCKSIHQAMLHQNYCRLSSLSNPAAVGL